MSINTNFLCSLEEFNNLKSREPVSCICIACLKEYTVLKHRLQGDYAATKKPRRFCSRICQGFYNRNRIIADCTNCGNEVEIPPSAQRSTNTFCTSSCSATYNNKNKMFGTRRSKLECYIEKRLTEEFPTLSILFSGKSIIGSELDIYIPSLKLAFEIQGIFHFQPIFGDYKLKQIQANDLLKEEACKNLDITLHAINTETHTYVTDQTCEPYFLQVYERIQRVLDSN